VPPQSVWPITHIAGAMQAPPTHICPAAQALPQEPQFIASRVVSTQLPPQSVCPASHMRIIAVHMPFMHDWPAVQALPQEPQLLALLVGSTQVPSHSICGAVQRGPVSTGPVSISFIPVSTTEGRSSKGLPPASSAAGSPVLQPIPVASAHASNHQRILVIDRFSL